MGKIKPLAQSLVKIVKETQLLAIQRIKHGKPIRDMDIAARANLKDYGYNEYFTHNLGHGVGLEIHEAPRLSSKEDSLLHEGMVITIEPGIYLPAEIGVRIEDMAVVTRKGAQVLSGTIN